MIVRTRIFELYDGHYRNLTELAAAMGISVSQVYRVRDGSRGINQKFIVGAIRAFPDYTPTTSSISHLIRTFPRDSGQSYAVSPTA